MAIGWRGNAIEARTRPQASGGRSAAKPARVFGRVGAHPGQGDTRTPPELSDGVLVSHSLLANYFAALLVI